MEQTTISDVVDEYIISRGYDDRSQYPRLLNLCIRGLKEMNLDVSGEPTFAALELDSNNTAAIPCGMLNIIRMLMSSEQYGLLEITESKDLPPTIVSSDGDESKPPFSPPNTDTEDYAYGYFGSSAGHYRVGQFTGGYYKGSMPNPYLYRRNYDTNRFEFSSNVAFPIIEYLTDPKMVNGEHVVHPLIEEPLLYWLHHADGRFSDKLTANTKAFNQRRYVASKNHAAQRMANMTAGNMRAGGRAGYSLTQK